MRRFSSPSTARRTRAICPALALFSLAACAPHRDALPFYEDASLTPTWPQTHDASTPAAHRIGDFTLVDQTGAHFSADSLDGRVHIANFFFAECGDVCPITTRELLTVEEAFADDDRVLIASYTVAPERDSVSTLATYAAHRGIDHRRWRLLTGDRATIQALGTSYLIGLGAGSAYGVDSVAHTEMLVLVDGHRRIRGVYNGTLRLDIRQLIADTRTLLAAQPRSDE